MDKPTTEELIYGLLDSRLTPNDAILLDAADRLAELQAVVDKLQEAVTEGTPRDRINWSRLNEAVDAAMAMRPTQQREKGGRSDGPDSPTACDPDDHA